MALKRSYLGPKTELGYRFPPLPDLPRDTAGRSAFNGADPHDYFAHTLQNHPLGGARHLTGITRMVRKTDPEKHILIYTDGSCLNQNSSSDTGSRTAGCAVVYGTQDSSDGSSKYKNTTAFRLEDYGPE